MKRKTLPRLAVAMSRLEIPRYTPIINSMNEEGYNIRISPNASHVVVIGDDHSREELKKRLIKAQQETNHE